MNQRETQSDSYSASIRPAATGVLRAAVLADDDLQAFHNVEFFLDYPAEREQNAQHGSGKLGADP